MFSEAASEYSSQWAAIESIAAKIGCTPETLRRRVRQQERDTGRRPGPTTAEEERIKALEREVRELRRQTETASGGKRSQSGVSKSAIKVVQVGL